MKNFIVSVLFLMAVQAQLANAYAVYPAVPIPKWFSEPYHGTIDYYAPSPANCPDVAVAGPWAYLSVSAVSQVVEQVPYILTDVPDFLSQNNAVATSSTLVRTKRKNVLHYRNGEFRPTLCSPRLCLFERPMGESEE